MGTHHKATERHLPYEITHPTQVNAPCLNPSYASRYSIYLPCRDGRLSWPSWLVTYRDGLPVRRQSPIQVVTTWQRPDRESNSWPFDHKSSVLTVTPPTESWHRHTWQWDLRFNISFPSPGWICLKRVPSTLVWNRFPVSLVGLQLCYSAQPLAVASSVRHVIKFYSCFKNVMTHTCTLEYTRRRITMATCSISMVACQHTDQWRSLETKVLRRLEDKK